MVYFLWSGVFSTNPLVFGYNSSEMLTYVFLTLIVATFVLSAPSADNIGGEISNGELSNYLLRPVNYIKYWFVRDLSSKLLNMVFAFIEISIMYLLLRPVLILPNSWLVWVGFGVMCLLAVVLNYFISCAARFVAFWTPESTWGVAFVVLVLVDVLGGGVFPIDILPDWGQVALQFTPFPYLIYYPIAVFIGEVTGWELVRILIQTILWVVISYFLAKWIWKKGLMVYGSEGR